MLVERGKVKKARAGRVVVAIERGSSCQSCAARGACLVFGPTQRRVEVLDPLGAAEGDEVEIGLPEARVVFASSVAYLVPVAAMILGALVATQLAPGLGADESAALGALVGLGLAALGIWIHGRATRDARGAMPVVVRVLSRAPAVDSECSVG